MHIHCDIGPALACLYLLADCRGRCAHSLQTYNLGRSTLCDHLLNLIRAQGGERDLEVTTGLASGAAALPRLDTSKAQAQKSLASEKKNPNKTSCAWLPVMVHQD